MKKNISLLLVLIASISYSQNLDSLFNRFMEIRGKSVNSFHVTSSTDLPDKCSFGLVNSIKKNFNNFSVKQKLALSSVLSRPVTDTSFVSPSGKFRIHFNKSGVNKPTYNVDELAAAADYSYRYEIDTLKYPPPAKYGDGKYDIYIQSLGSATYGYTELDSSITASTSTSFSLINSDYSSFPTKGMDAVKVTVAHEFHHAIQVGNYIYRLEDTYYHELTSTSMEEIVYHGINDYINYLPNYFSVTGKALAQHSGYDLAIWNLYLKDRFGVNIIKEMWEKMPTKRAVDCFSSVLQNHGTTLLSEFNQFGVWTYFTNTRTISGQYFKDAAKYPLIKSTMKTQFANPTTTVSVTSEAITNNFIEVSDGANTIMALVTNADTQSSVNNQGTVAFDLTISRSQSSGFGSIYGGYFSKISSSNISLLTDSYLYNGKLVSRIMNMEYPYPQPFNYSKYSTIYFPAELTSDGEVDLNIFSIDMNLIYSTQTTIVPGDKVVVSWNALDNNGKKLSSGVYLYVVKCGDNIRKGKFVILND